MISGKVWGDTSEVFNKNNVEIHRICVKPGGFCSKHRHAHKYNSFFVESGDLSVSVWKNDYDLVDKTTLVNGMHTAVAPGEWHRFESKRGCIAYEIYWVEMEGKDIERESTGGLRR